MKSLSLKLVYGSEFWVALKFFIQSAKQRIFLMSAYWGKDTYDEIKECLPDDIDCYFFSRSDSPFIPPEAIIFQAINFHGKLYLFDNNLIIGSQNLYKAKKVREGEFNIVLSTDDDSASNIIYQAIQAAIKCEDIYSEPVDKTFLKIYDEGFCPFCSNININEESDVNWCTQYRGYVTREDCISYDGSGACKYCGYGSDDNSRIESCWFCNELGCGLGITNNGDLLYHAFNCGKSEDKEKAYDFLKLYNFLAKQLNFLAKQPNNNPINFLKKLGLIGKIYDVTTKMSVQSFINIDSEISKQEIFSSQIMKNLEKQIDLDIEKKAKKQEIEDKDDPFGLFR